MTKKERVLAALHRKPTDKIPKGEVWIDGTLANKLLNADFPTDYMHFERDKAVRELLGMDLVNVGDWPQEAIGRDQNGNTVYRSVYGYEFIQGASKHITKAAVEDIEKAWDYVKPDIKRVDPTIVKRFAEETDFFVFAQIGGPVSMLDEMFPMEDYLVYCLTHTEEIRAITDKVMAYEVEKAKLFIENGAEGIFFADDIAYNMGLFLPPQVMDVLAFHYYSKVVKEIKAFKDVPIVAHSDGYIYDVLDKYVEAGFDGIMSLQPSAGMDIAKVKKNYGDKLCLWGNIDLDYIMCYASPEEVRRTVRQTIEAAGLNGGFILSTCNCMVDSIPPENVLAMMEEAEQLSI